jgi:hypothetical protein
MTDTPIMTETEEEGQFYEEPIVKVHLESQSAELTRADSADKASYLSYTLSATNPGPVKLLSRQPNRHRAIVQVTTSASSVLINKSVEALQATVPIGVVVNNNVQLALENIEGLWAIWQTGTPVISVIDELWITEPKESE